MFALCSVLLASCYAEDEAVEKKTEKRGLIGLGYGGGFGGYGGHGLGTQKFLFI